MNGEAEKVKKRVAIVDDELNGLKHKHLILSEMEFIEDRTSIELEELWTIISGVKKIGTLAENSNEQIQEFIKSDEFINDILTSDSFRSEASEQLQSKFSMFFSKRNTIEKQKNVIENIFNSDDFEITYIDPRPEVAGLLEFDFIMLDLIMNVSHKPIDQLCEYLKDLSTEAGTNKLPPIVLFSTNPDLSDARMQFAKSAKISSAGMYILDKALLLEDQFSGKGLRLVYDQLVMQNDAANHMRNFINAYDNALLTAKGKIEDTLWNLDAGALQKIHRSAYSDNDPYDEHLNELISREYSWHVESNADVMKSLESLDKSLLQHLSDKEINYHFVVPYEQKHSRDLISHFTWFGSSTPSVFNTLEKPQAIALFNKLIPYGSLLIDDRFLETNTALIHITQQCDLNDISRELSGDNHVMFATVQAIKVENHRIRTYKNSELVAKCYQIDGVEYDFLFTKGKTISISVDNFLDEATKSHLKVVGRLRHDITNLFKQATVSDLIRPAAQKLEREEFFNAKIFLRGAQFTAINPFVEDDTTHIFSIMKYDKKYCLVDQEALDISMWIAQQLKEKYSPTFDNLNLNELCQLLIKGSIHQKQLLQNFHLHIIEKNDISAVDADINGVNATGNIIRLIYVIETKA